MVPGDITIDDAVKLAKQDFGTWSGNAPQLPEIGEARPFGPGKVYIVDRQDAAQTVVMQLLPGTERKAGDYYAVRLADAVWGGGFGTRLNLNLREDKGYSYDVFSFPRAAKNYAAPSKATLLLVGDRSKIEPGVRELNLGEIVFLDVEGRPVEGK